MAMKQFKAESKRLLDLMINSIYTHKDIFLRELISNCSDAIDKRHFMSLTEGDVKNDYEILIGADKDNKILTISDNGCGMNKEALEANLGTIAQSGTLAFKKEAKTDEALIGQFGVGFYSAFMVAKKVTVLSRAYKSDEAFLWQSEGAEGYTIEPSVRPDYGTTVTLYLKEDDEDCTYSDYLDSYTVKELIKKYSDYIRYPIKMNTSVSRLKEGSESEYETVDELTTLNGMVPLWKKPKGQVSQDEYNEFYRAKFRDFTPPQKVLAFNIEGNINYNALIFLPEKPPLDFYSREFQKGLMLYCGGVLIMENCGDLLPDYLGFARGVVDSPDLSLNISREMLQKDRQLRAIAVNLEKKILAELEKMLKNEREAYEKFFKEFGASLKMGAYENFGAKKDSLKDLLLYTSSKEKKYVSLAEYVSRMAEGQDKIYYAVGESAEKLEKLPQAEKVAGQGFEILYLTDRVDEFVIKMMEQYSDKKFVSVADAPLTEAEKQEAEKLDGEHKSLLEKIKNILGAAVDRVCFSSGLNQHPVCLTHEGEISLEMEKVLRAMPGNEFVRAKKVLMINAGHPLTQKLIGAENDEALLGRLVQTLYGVARLLADLPIENGAKFAGDVVSFL